MLELFSSMEAISISTESPNFCLCRRRREGEEKQFQEINDTESDKTGKEKRKKEELKPLLTHGTGFSEMFRPGCRS